MVLPCMTSTQRKHWSTRTNSMVWPIPYACAPPLSPGQWQPQTAVLPFLGAHEHGIASTVTLAITDPPFYCWGGCISTPLSASSTLNMWLLLVGNWKTVLPRHAYGDGIHEFAYIWQSEQVGIITMQSVKESKFSFWVMFSLASIMVSLTVNFYIIIPTHPLCQKVGHLMRIISKSTKRKTNAHSFMLSTEQ